MNTFDPSLARAGLPFFVLELIGRREGHGYEIIRRLRAASGGSLSAGEGTIYPLLGRFSRRGWLRERRGRRGRRGRRVYHLTALGRRALAERRAEWRRFAALIARLARTSRRAR